MVDLAAAALLERLEALARAAGEVILEVYATDFTVERKDDDSPVTEADRRAEAIILPGLRALLQGVPVVAEEASAEGQTPQVGDTFWLVDPLDGTKEFIRRNGEFTVNIGLVVQGTPVLGVVFAPALNVLWSGARWNGAILAFREDHTGRRSIGCRRPPGQGAVVLTSRSHASGGEAWANTLEHPVQEVLGSSLKFCRVAEGSADYYPRLGPTSEWDTAAGHAILRAAQGSVTTLAGEPLAYGKPRFLNPDFVARGLPLPESV